MEIDFLRNKFTINEAVQLNPLVLAFVGDAIYEVFVRRYLVEQNQDMSAHKLHVKAVSYVKAHSQSEIMKQIKESLTEEEERSFLKEEEMQNQEQFLKMQMLESIEWQLALKH